MSRQKQTKTHKKTKPLKNKNQNKRHELKAQEFPVAENKIAFLTSVV